MQPPQHRGAWLDRCDATRRSAAGCYYGEYPLAFAVSVGAVKICDLLYRCKQERLAEPRRRRTKQEEADRELQRSRRCALLRRSPGAQPAASDDVSPVEDELLHFLTAVDMFGNTAAHMAVLYGRYEALDWLMRRDTGQRSLETLNLDGLTPFTLAVREGNVGMYKYILNNYLCWLGWSYGRKRMRQMDLLQVLLLGPLYAVFSIRVGVLSMRPSVKAPSAPRFPPYSPVEGVGPRAAGGLLPRERQRAAREPALAERAGGGGGARGGGLRAGRAVQPPRHGQVGPLRAPHVPLPHHGALPAAAGRLLGRVRAARCVATGSVSTLGSTAASRACSSSSSAASSR